jgi:hypothetical protein
MDSTARPPAARSKALAVRLGIVAAAVALGLLLQEALSERLARIVREADQDVVAARRDLAFLMRAVFVPVLALTTATGLAISRSARRSLRESCFPPAGSRLWSHGSRVVTGEPARRLARIGIGLGLALALCSLAAGGLLWWITRVLLLCRA